MENHAASSHSPVADTARLYTTAGQFSSIEWAVNRGGKRVLEGQAGFADYQRQSAIPDNAIYRIYSMTKPLVSVAALLLMQQQKLKLYDPVSRFIPAFSSQKILASDGSLHSSPAAATIEHLLTHRAGLSYDFLPNCRVAERYREMSLAEDGSRSLPDLVDCLAQAPAICAAGERWCYSYATDVLAHVIEIASGQSIDDYLQQHLFAPLGMSDTRFYVAEADRHRLMPMYGSDILGSVMGPPAAVQALTPLDVESAYPSREASHQRRGGVGLFSTTADYMRFAEFMHTGSNADGQPLLCAAMHDMMWANRISVQQLPLSIGPNVLYGYGWNLAGRVMLDIGQAMGVSSQGEGGWAGAASTYFWVDRRRSVSGVVMTQYLRSALPVGLDMHSAATIELT